MLAPWKKNYDQPRQHIKKQSHYFVAKGSYNHAVIFPVVMYGCDSWTINKVERWGINAFELWCWRRLLRAPWTLRLSKQSILKEINPEHSLEGLMLRLKLQYFGHVMWRADSLGKEPWCWERLRTGERNDRGRDGWMASPTQWTWVWESSGRQWRTGKPGMLQFMGSQTVGRGWVTEEQQTVVHQVPLSVGFPRQEYWSRLPFPSPGDIPDPGIGLTSPILQADSLPLSHGLP